jgi:CheY-like chemotaxis protein
MNRLLHEGAGLCLAKPVKQAALRQGLFDLFSRRTQQAEKRAPVLEASAPEVSSGRHSWLSGKKILIADDNPINRQLVEILLQELGAHVLSAADGREAVKIAAAETPDLALLDIHMPHMNGFEVAAAIRRLPGGSTLPLVAMTADAMWRNRQQITRSGFRAYLLKPIEEQELWLILQDTLFQKRLPAPPATMAGKIPGRAQLGKAPESLPARDEAQALRITGGSRSIAENLFAQFIESLPGEVSTIGELLEKEQWTELWQSIHHLQGTVAVCGVPALSAALKALQASVHEEDREAALAAYRQVIREQQRLLQLSSSASDSLLHRA